LAGILSLKPDDEMSLHPEALKWFSLLRKQIEFEVPLKGLTDDDLNMFLTDDEKRDYNSLMGKIGLELSTCINKSGAPPNTNIWDEIASDLKATQAGINLLVPMNSLKFLLEKVYERKVAKAKEERRKLEEEEKRKAEEAREEQRTREEKAEAERREKEDSERWCAAYVAVKPPLDDAKKYLNDEECDKFEKATWKAVDIYMEKGEDYLHGSGTFDYRWYLKKINDRKEKEQLVTAAKLRAKEYNQRLNKEKLRLKALLGPNRKDHESYFRKEVKDRRYTGQSFTQFLSKEEEQYFDKTIVDIGRKKLDEIVSSDFRQFIDGNCWRSYFLLPSTEYSLAGVPCLDFMFDVFAIVEVRVWLKPGQKNFGDYVFNLPVREEKGYSVLLQEPELLGYHYLVLTPEDLGGYSFWQSIPLALLRGLLSGQTRPNGTTISAASDSMITYKIPKFREEVTIPDSIASYLKNIGNIDQLVSMGIITEKIASVAKNEVGEPKAADRALSLEGDSVRKDSKKAKAFELFSQGKRPSSPEVKTLGLHKSTRFKYYNQYLSVHKA